jgi:hypothetical protein
MQYAVDMGSGGTIQVITFIKIDLGVQNIDAGEYTYGQRQKGDLISLLLVFQNLQSRLEMKYMREQATKL